MPQFAPGEVKKAKAPITVKPLGLSCQVELALMSNGAKIATSVVPFTSTGVEQPVSLPITMPGVEGTYPVYIDILAEGLLIGAYQATEDVVIAPVGPAWAASAIRTTDSGIPRFARTIQLSSIDVTNLQQIAAHCKLTFYARGKRRITDAWEIWRVAPGCDGWISKVYEESLQICYTLVMMEADLNPGETKTFSHVLWMGIHAPDMAYTQVKFVGPFGEVLSGTLPRIQY